MIELYIANDLDTPESRINLLGKRFRESGASALWNPALRSSGATVTPVTEVIPAVLLGEPEEIAFARNRIDLLRETIIEYVDNSVNPTGYWLYWRHNAGTAKLRDPISDLWWEQSQEQSGHILDRAMLGNLIVKCVGNLERTLTLKRGYDVLNRAADSALIPNNSTTDSRIEKLRLRVDTNLVVNTAQFYDVWMGIREEGEGLEDFDPTPHFGKGTPIGGMGSGGHITINPGATACYYMTIDDILSASGGDPNHYKGRYTILLLQESPDINNFWFLKYGDRNNTNHVVGNLNANRRVYPTVAGWQLLNLGEVSIGENRGLTNNPADFILELWCGRDSGSAASRISDSAPFIFIPSNRFLYTRFNNVFSVGAEANFYFYQTPRLKNLIEIQTATGSRVSTVPNVRRFNVPSKGGLLVYAIQEDDGFSFDDGFSADLWIDYYPTWISYPNVLNLEREVNYDF